MWYVEVLGKTYNEGDRTFYDAITVNGESKWRIFSQKLIKPGPSR